MSDGLIASPAQSILAVAKSNFRSLQGVPIEDIVLLSTIPNYPEQDQVELSKEIWSTVSTVVLSVTIALESGASPNMLSNDNAAASAAIDRNYFISSRCFPQKCKPRTSSVAHRICPIIGNQGLQQVMAPEGPLSRRCPHNNRLVLAAGLHRHASIPGDLPRAGLYSPVMPPMRNQS